jgi:hypothetical protein
MTHQTENEKRSVGSLGKVDLTPKVKEAKA